jgi:hydroxymethylpyrimidine pyrophosphatase-like HAD family hydrolase
MKKDALTNKLIENIINICKKLRLTPEKLTRDKFREAAKKFELSNHYEGNYTVAKNAASKIFNNKAKIDKLVQNNIVQEKISDEANEKKETEEKNRVVESRDITHKSLVEIVPQLSEEDEIAREESLNKGK